LKDLCEAQGITTFMLLLAVFELVLYRYTGQKDFAIGTPVANREQAQTENLPGFFANTLAIRSDLQDGQNISDFLQAVKQRCLAAFAHQQAPFEQVVEALCLERYLDSSPVFQVMLSLNSQTFSSKAQESTESALLVDSIELARQQVKFELTLELTDTGTGLDGLLEYNTSLFDEDSIVRLGEHIHFAIEQLVDHKNSLHQAWDLLPACDLASLE